MHDVCLIGETLPEATLDRVATVNGLLNALVSMREVKELLAEAQDRPKTTGTTMDMYHLRETGVPGTCPPLLPPGT